MRRRLPCWASRIVITWARAINGNPVAAVLARAGHDHMLHLLPRGIVEPPQELLDLIFSGVEELLADKKQVTQLLRFVCRLCQPFQCSVTSLQNLPSLTMRQMCRAKFAERKPRAGKPEVELVQDFGGQGEKRQGRQRLPEPPLSSPQCYT